MTRTRFWFTVTEIRVKYYDANTFCCGLVALCQFLHKQSDYQSRNNANKVRGKPKNSALQSILKQFITMLLATPRLPLWSGCPANKHREKIALAESRINVKRGNSKLEGTFRMQQGMLARNDRRTRDAIIASVLCVHACVCVFVCAMLCVMT